MEPKTEKNNEKELETKTN